MNYLAHALLSPPDPLITMGNLWGDLLKPRDYEQLPKEMLEGIAIHRRIDSFTDQHQAVEKIVRILRPFQGKYTPVVVDVLMDYMLSKYWEKFNTKSLDRFCKEKYTLVARHLKFIPDRLHPRINAMLSNQWLESCSSDGRMEKTLIMLSKRASFENSIPQAMIPYHEHRETLDELFLLFFKDMRQHINPQSGG